MKRLGLSIITCVLLGACLAASPTTQPGNEPGIFPPSADGHEARRIVFVCDGSGAMLNCWNLVRHQLETKLDSMVGAQSFDILLTGTKEPAAFSGGLVPVSSESKGKAKDWLENQGGRSGGSDMIAAIDAAFALKPELIYLLDIGDYPDNPAVLRRIDFLNNAHAVRIITTAMIEDATNTDWTETFQTIARQNGGVYVPIDLSTYGGHAGTGSSMFVPAPSHGKPERIAFICDASGSMLNKFATLRRELIKAVADLRPSQSFNLIFMQEAGRNVMGPELLKATPENKKAVSDFLDNKVTPRGETNPMPAIEAAFAEHPQVIYLLTDGDFPDNAAVLKRIGELNANHQVRVNTIAFVSQADTDTAFFQLLRQIAKDNGGAYRKVDEAKMPN